MLSIRTFSLLLLVGITTAAPPADNQHVARAHAYMTVVNNYRTRLGLPKLTWGSKLEANALKTCIDGNGEMVHELNPPSNAQVLAPGTMDEFKRIFVGGWLCERPNAPGLNDDCKTLGQGWAHDGQTGHADILMSDRYTHIGCAGAKGVVGCDLR